MENLRLLSSLLRIRGGISEFFYISVAPAFSSPHTRRYFPSPGARYPGQLLFSAYAEVFPIRNLVPAQQRALLRIRGGISTYGQSLKVENYSSPHTRRYFRAGPPVAGGEHLFSAYAEVFPRWPSRRGRRASLLRIRGGISLFTGTRATPPASSPHTRRYFQTY